MKRRETWRHRGKTIRAVNHPKVGRYYVVDEYAALGKGFRKRADARAAIDAVIEFADRRRGERGPKDDGPKIEYRGRAIIRVENSKRGYKRYRVEGFTLERRPFVSVNSAIAAIDDALDVVEAAGAYRTWDALPMNDNK